MLEVIHTNFHLLKNFRWNCFFLEVNFWEISSQCFHCCFSNEGCKICSNESVGIIENPIDFKIISNRHLPCVNIHDFLSSITVWDTNLDFSVESSGSSKSWVECISSVGCTNDNNIVSALHPIHQRKHLRNNTSFNFTTNVFTLRTNRIDFIDEDDRRRVFACFIKDFS